MAVTINASTTAGLVQTADTSGVLALQTAGTTAVTVDASQNVTLAGKLGVTKRATFTASSFDAIAASTGTMQGQTSYGGVLAGYGSSYDVMICNRNGSEAFGVVANTTNVVAAGSLQGASTISVGNATPSTSGAGITFPATQSASSDANTLDDYEEGTFTPTIIGKTTAGTGTYSNQTGSYVKVGQMVSIYIRMDWSAHTGTGNMGFGGLPFTTAGTYTNGAAVNGMAGMTVPASCYIAANVDASATTGIFLAIPVGGGNDNQMAIDTSGILLFTITYRASA